MTRRLEETGLDGQTEKKKELVTVCRVFNLWRRGRVSKVSGPKQLQGNVQRACSYLAAS
jgi:hypothetical protein